MASTERDPRVARIMKRYHAAREQRQKMNLKWAELDKFYNGEQYFWERIPPWIPKPVTNYIHLVVTTKRAALAMENATGQLLPLSEADAPLVKKLQKVYEWVWERAKVQRVVRQNLETALLLGTAIAHVYWDEYTGVLGGTNAEYEGEIRVCEIDPSNFFPDPTAYRLEDCQYIHVVERKPREWIEQMFGVNLKEYFADGYSWTDTEIYERDYYYDMNNREDGLIELHSHYEKYWNREKVKTTQPVIEVDPETGEEIVVGEEEVEEEIGGWRYKCTYIAGGKVLKVIDPLEPNMYPFAILYDYPRRKDFWGKSTADLILDLQKLVNKTESTVSMIGTLLQNPQRLVRKDSGIDPREAMKYSTEPGRVWVVNSQVPLGEAMKWMEPPQIPPTLLNLSEVAKANIREITGLNEAYLGQPVGSLQTSTGVDALIDRATMRDRDKMVEIEEYIEQLSRLLIAFISTKYTDRRYMRIVEDPTNPEETTRFEEFIGTAFQGLDYDFEINVSAKAPVSRMRRKAEAQELLQIQGQYGFSPALITPEEFIEDSDFAEKDKILARMHREKLMLQTEQLFKVAQMMFEAMANGIPDEEVMQMGQQYLQQIQSGQIDPNAMEAPPLGPEGIGSAADNIQDHQAQIPTMPMP